MFISARIHKNEQFVGMVGMHDKHRNIMKHRMMNVFFRPFKGVQLDHVHEIFSFFFVPASYIYVLSFLQFSPAG